MLKRTPSATPDRSGIGSKVIRVLIDGLMVVVPIGAIVLLIIGIWQRLSDAAKPVSGPFGHPALAGAILLLLLCLVIGFLVRSAVGRWVQQALEVGAVREDPRLSAAPGFRRARPGGGAGPSTDASGARRDRGGPVPGAGRG